MVNVEPGVQDEQADDRISAAVREILASRPHFKVADRVRVQLSGECRVIPNPGSYADKRGLTGHQPDEDGLEGVVHFIDEPTDPLSRQGHAYQVHYLTARLHREGRAVCCGQYAPTELELIS